MTNLERLETLAALVEQLIKRLEHEKSVNQRMSAQLANKEGELMQLRKQFNAVREMLNGGKA